MKKTMGKKRNTASPKPKALSFKQINEITYRFWRHRILAGDDQAAKQEAKGEFIGEDEQGGDWEGEGKKWGRDEEDEEPGEFP
jgi:hypothetical protein